jgi:O-antigen ligase
MTYFLTVTTIIGAIVLPEWFALIFLYLSITVITSRMDILPVLSIDQIDILLADMVIIIVICKILLRATVEKNSKERIRSAFFPGLLAFLVIMTSSIFLSYVRFDREVFLTELVPFLRFLGLQIGGFYLLVSSVSSFKQLNKACKSMRWLGYLVASSIYLSLLLYPYEIAMGEVNLTHETIRYQGLLGDSVKLFLLPFIFVSILSRKWTATAFLSVALLITGGRLGFLGLLVGFMIIAVVERKRLMTTKFFLTLFSAVMIGGLGLWLNVGGMATRFTNPEEISTGLEPRLATWSIALEMAADNIFTGVGFGGYRLFEDEYSLSSSWNFRPFMGDTHSQALKSLVDAGLLGLTAFIWMMWDVRRIMNKSSKVCEGELQIILKSGNIFVLTLAILSPFTSWILPLSWISYFLFMITGIAISTLNVSSRVAVENNNFELKNVAMVGKNKGVMVRIADKSF